MSATRTTGKWTPTAANGSGRRSPSLSTETEYEEVGRRVHDLVAETLRVIGVIGQGPAPVLVSNDLENVLPETVLSGEDRVWWGAANCFWHPHRAEQWFVKT